MNALVTLLVPPFQDLTYRLPDCFPDSFWQPGLRVAVPLGGGPARPGVIRELDVPAPEGVRLKNVLWPLETTPLLCRGVMELIRAAALRGGLASGAAAPLPLPFALTPNVSRRRLDGGAPQQPASGRLPGLEPKRRPKGLSLTSVCQSSLDERRQLAAELAAGRARMLPPKQDAARTERCILACEAPWPVRPNAARQIQCLETLLLHGAVNRRQLIRDLGAGGAAVVDALIRQGLVRLESDEDDARAEELNERLLEPSRAQELVLTGAQQAAVDALTPLLDGAKTAQRLLYGVTGSGKTAVYLAAARACLEMGRSVLLLAPEVALAHKLRRDCAQALPGARLVFYHGYQSQRRREVTFRALAGSHDPCVVIGTRSALFLPVPGLGLIILDEEHDPAFKQEERVPYQAKEAAWYKAGQAKALMLLGSATPDIKTWHAAMEGRLPVLRLPGRIGGRALPPVELVSMEKTRFMDDRDTMLAPATLQALDETLARGEQAIILLNRRGFAPLIYCADCRATLSCPNCSVGLTYHRDLGRLLCHYCGYSMDFPAPCPACRHMNFLPMGEGTERTADYLTARYGRGVLRFDRDTTRRAGAMEELLARFAGHEADILVGTQMVSKGHHFPDVTLAVVADGDLGLSLPDYRAAERTFQLLVQSAGRAGRGEKPGRVLIQTRDTRHYCWQYIQRSDYEGFYAAELERRRRFRYPPFSRVTLIRFSHERGDTEASEALQELEQWLKHAARGRGLNLLGPVPSPLPVISSRMRFQCLLKTADWSGPRLLYHDLSLQKAARKLRISLDLDPVNML